MERTGQKPQNNPKHPKHPPSLFQRNKNLILYIFICDTVAVDVFEPLIQQCLLLSDTLHFCNKNTSWLAEWPAELFFIVSQEDFVT